MARTCKRAVNTAGTRTSRNPHPPQTYVQSKIEYIYLTCNTSHHAHWLSPPAPGITQTRAGGFTVDLLTPVRLVTVGEGCNERKDKKWKETENSSLASIPYWAFCFSTCSSCITCPSFYFWCSKSIINFFQKEWTSPVLDLAHKALTLREAKSKTKTGKRDRSWQIEGHDIWDREKQEWKESLD